MLHDFLWDKNRRRRTLYSFAWKIESEQGILVSFLKIVLVYCSLVYKWNYNGGQKEVYRMRRKFTKFLYLTRTTNKQNKRVL